VPAKKTKYSRWTADLPDNASRPLGSEESMQRAVERLGPFKYRRDVDAERFGPWGGPNNRFPLSEEFAIEQVLRLARIYNQQAHLESGAPRLKNVIDDLIKLETLSGELARYINSIDDMSRHALKTAGSGTNRFLEDWTSPLIEAAEVPSLPAPGVENGPCQWVHRLESLSQYTNLVVTNLLAGRGITNHDALDKGGNTNLYKNIHGTAQWNFVNQGWHIHEIFKSGTSTGTEDGPFHRFLLDVFEYATGRPDESSRLMHWVKHVSKVNRQSAELTKRELALIREQSAVDRRKPSLAERKQRYSEIEEKMKAISRERYELWPQLYPFTYPE
jgi:hypothetical protein